MKKTNFWKGLTMAAVALVSVFATSCSEEEIKINGGDVDVDVPTITLPDAKAIISITVVDLEAGKTVGVVQTKDVTSAIGSSYTVECPENEGYTTANDITVQIPSIEKGQTIVIPVTFYVVTLDSAFEDLIEESTVEETVLEGEENILTNTLTFINKNGWVDGVYTNTEANEVTSTAVFGNYFTGYNYIAVSSRATEHQTSIEELMAHGLVFEVGEYEEEVTIPGYSIYTLEPIVQEIRISEIVLKDKSGEVIFKATAKKAGAVTINGSATSIKHDAPGHDEPGHDDGHGHGHGNSNNAGGGTGSDNGGE